MGNIFLHIFNIGWTAAWIVPVVLVLRLVLAKAPRWIHCGLWGVVGLRLLLPFRPESILSLIPSAEPLPPESVMTPTPTVDTGFAVVDRVINPVLSESMRPEIGASVNPMQVALEVAGTVWLLGAVLLLLVGGFSYLRLVYRVRPSISCDRNVYLCDGIDTPFILGVFRPRIYLPSGISEDDKEYVLRHERAHLVRRDYLWKPLGFLLLAVYWFHPLLWVAYIYLCRDIERACDERVVKTMDLADRRGYSEALLSCSIHSRRMILVCPLAFGEVGVKSRIRSVLNYKKPAFWIIIIALIASVVVGICFLTNPPSDPKGESPETESTPAAQIYRPVEVSDARLAELKAEYPEYFALDASNGLDVYVGQLASRSYSCFLLPYSEETQTWSAFLGTTLPSLRIETMQEILSSYALNAAKIRILPCNLMHSSYAQPMGDGYLAKLYAKFDMPAFYNSERIASVDYDIDRDGAIEHCVLRKGCILDRFTFVMEAWEKDSPSNGVADYTGIFVAGLTNLSFASGPDGVLRVEGTTGGENPVTHPMDIRTEEGLILLSEDGADINDMWDEARLRSFAAVIHTVNEESVLVIPAVGTTEAGSAASIRVALPTGYDVSRLKVGKTVTVSYRGTLVGGLPAEIRDTVQINTDAYSDMSHWGFQNERISVAPESNVQSIFRERAVNRAQLENGGGYPMIRIRSREELLALYREVLMPPVLIPPSEQILPSYDEEFFAENELLMLYHRCPGYKQDAFLLDYIAVTGSRIIVQMTVKDSSYYGGFLQDATVESCLVIGVPKHLINDTVEFYANATVLSR